MFSASCYILRRPLFICRSAQSHGSTDKNRGRGVEELEELEELESMTPAAYSEPPRNIQLSLRSASAKKKSSTLPRRSARLVPKVCVHFHLLIITVKYEPTYYSFSLKGW
jgi:hypothetical protein